MPFVLAIDISTTHTKAVFVNERGRVLAAAKQFIATSFPQPGYNEQNPEEIFDVLVRVIKETAIGNSGIKPLQ
jgi:sugar (pentulose or hexulose) kinase